MLDDVMYLSTAFNHSISTFKRSWPLFLSGCFLVLLWGRFFWSLISEWELDPQYAHGWFIPVLAGVLCLGRWNTRPPIKVKQTIWPIVAGFVLIIPLLPLRFLEAVYPEARPFHWFHVIIVSLVTLAWLLSCGGWRWVWHFAFPVAFVLLAVPWPRSFQNELTNSLMFRVASMAVEIISLLGIPAWQQGNTIALMGGVVGVDEACSGIRSLQGSIMVGLFLGEWLGLRALARVALVSSAVVMALIFNVVRATFLTWVCAGSGEESLHRYHDPAGMIILVVVFFACLGLAKIFAMWNLKKMSEIKISSTPSISFFSGYVACFSLFWLMFTDAACALYYQQSPDVSSDLRWDIHLDRAPGKVTPNPIGETARQFLRFDSGVARTIDGPDNVKINVIDLKWKGGEISAAGARLHSPLICLPSAGYKLQEILDPISLNIQGIECIFDAGKYDVGGASVYVYHCIWEAGRPMTLVQTADQSFGSAIRAVRERRRLAQTRVLLIMFSGVTSTSEASKALHVFLEQVISITKSQG